MYVIEPKGQPAEDTLQLIRDEAGMRGFEITDVRKGRGDRSWRFRVREAIAPASEQQAMPAPEANSDARRNLAPATDEISAQLPNQPAAEPEPKPATVPSPAEAPVPTDAGAEKAPAHDFQSTQANLPAELAEKIKRNQRSLDPDDVLKLEDQPHITVLFGLHPGVNVDDVKGVLASQGPIRVIFGANGTFPADDDGVPLYVSVDSTDVHRINGMLSAVLPNTSARSRY
jgi:hypothetical protein